MMENLPEAVREAVCQLPGAAERLLSAEEDGIPWTVEALEAVAIQLETIAAALIGHSTPQKLVLTLLSDSDFPLLVLRILAVSLRLERSGSANPRGTQDLVAAVCLIIGALLPHSALNEPVPHCVLVFASALLRMQALSSCSQALAVKSAELQRCQDSVGAAAPAAAPQEAAAPSQSALADGGPWRDAPGRTADAAVGCLGSIIASAVNTLESVSMLLRSVGSVAIRLHNFDHEAACVGTAVYMADLATALRESCVLEHVAHVTLLALEVAAAADTVVMGTQVVAAGAQQQRWKQEALLQPQRKLECNPGMLALALKRMHEAHERFHHCWRHYHGAAASKLVVIDDFLHEALAGPCATYLLLAGGFTVLSAVDGGTVHGLPPALQRSVAGATLLARGSSVQVTDPTAVRNQRDLRQLDGSAVTRMLDVLHLDLQSLPQLTRAVALATAFRAARAALASARAWTEFQVESPRAAHGAAATATGAAAGQEPSLAGAGACAIPAAGGPGSEPAAGGTGTGAVPAAVGAGAEPAPPALLSHDTVAAVAAMALLAADGLMPKPRGSAAWMVAATERWSLAVAVVEQRLAGVDDVQSLQTLAGLLHFDMRPLHYEGGALPDKPPPQVAAALAGGMVGCLERLLRRTGKEPDGPEAVLLTFLLLELTQQSPAAAGWSYLLWLLAYCDPREAAALVTTIAKVLRTFEPLAEDIVLKVLGAGAGDSSSSCGGGGGSGESGGNVAVIVGAVLSWCRGMLLQVFDFFSQSPQMGTAPRESACGAANPSAVVQRLLPLLTCAAGEWLPPMSRIVRRVAQRLIERGRLTAPVSCSSPDEGSSGNCGVDVEVVEVQRAANVLYSCLHGVIYFLPTLASDLLDVLPRSWTPPTNSLTNLQPVHRGMEGLSAAVVAAAAAAAADPAGSAARWEGWRRVLLEDVGAVEVLGAGLRLIMAYPALRAHWAHWDDMGLRLATAMHTTVLACPRELQAAARSVFLAAREAAGSVDGSPVRAGAGGTASTSTARAGVSSGGSSSSSSSRGGVYHSSSCSSGDGGDGSSSRYAVAAAKALKEASLAHWPDRYLKAFEAYLVAQGHHEFGSTINVLHMHMCILTLSATRVGALPATSMPGGCHPQIMAAGLAVVPPGVARLLLSGFCAHPSCANLAGDREAEVPLRACSGCGVARYCCKEHQTQHWKAGHRAECMARQLAAAARAGTGCSG